MPKGGSRKGAGRPRTHPLGLLLEPKTYWATPDDHEAIQELINNRWEKAEQAKTPEADGFSE